MDAQKGAGARTTKENRPQRLNRREHDAGQPRSTGPCSADAAGLRNVRLSRAPSTRLWLDLYNRPHCTRQPYREQRQRLSIHAKGPVCMQCVFDW
jgi:hypothetical protein